MDRYEKRRLILKETVDSMGRGGIAKIAKRCDIDATYLSRLLYPEGKSGKKRIGEDIKEKLEKCLGNIFDEHYKKQEGNVFYLQQDQLPENSYFVNPNKISHPPVIGKSMGGLPDNLFTDEGRIINGHDEFGEVFSSDTNAFITRVEGNSMYPKYHNGGYALIEPNTVPEIEDDVLVKIDTGQVMLKRLVSKRGGISLSSYNENETYLFSEEQIIWMYYVAYPVPERKIKNRV
jgi:SOS-response transcriptional repressor LexA